MTSNKTRIFRAVYLGCVYVFLYVPIFIIVFFSWNNARFSLIWHGWTWKWYATLMHNTELIHVACNSFLIGLIAASLSTFLGAVFAITLMRYRFFGRKILNGILLVMILIPDLVIGISLLLFFKSLHINLGFFSLLLAHVVLCLPFVLITVQSRLVHLDWSVLEAAKDLGGTEYTILVHIILRFLWPSLLSSWLLSFTLSLDDVMISYFVTGPDFEILPLKIFSMVKLGVNPEINALSSILFLLTVTIVLLTQALLRKKI